MLNAHSVHTNTNVFETEQILHLWRVRLGEIPTLSGIERETLLRHIARILVDKGLLLESPANTVNIHMYVCMCL